MGTKKHHYAVWVGRKVGIYSPWATARQYTDGFSGAKYEGFPTLAEAEECMLAVGAHKREDGTWIGPQSVREQFEAAQVQELSLDNAPQQDPGFDTPLFVVDVQPGDVVPDFPPRARCWHGFDGLSCDVVYVASACSIGPNGRDLGLGVFFGPENERNLSQRCSDKRSAEYAELVAIVRVLEALPTWGMSRLLIHTESADAAKRASAITAARISSGGPDALLQYLAALISKHGGRDRIRVQHVLELYDCGLVREARRGAQALARAGCTSHGAAEDWDAKRAALLVDPQAVYDADGELVLQIFD